MKEKVAGHIRSSTVSLSLVTSCLLAGCWTGDSSFNTPTVSSWHSLEIEKVRLGISGDATSFDLEGAKAIVTKHLRDLAQHCNTDLPTAEIIISMDPLPQIKDGDRGGWCTCSTSPPFHSIVIQGNVHSQPIDVAVLRHEIGHMLHCHLLGVRPYLNQPTWVAEGFAMACEGRSGSLPLSRYFLLDRVLRKNAKIRVQDWTGLSQKEIIAKSSTNIGSLQKISLGGDVFWIMFQAMAHHWDMPIAQTVLYLETNPPDSSLLQEATDKFMARCKELGPEDLLRQQGGDAAIEIWEIISLTYAWPMVELRSDLQRRLAISALNKNPETPALDELFVGNLYEALYLISLHQKEESALLTSTLEALDYRRHRSLLWGRIVAAVKTRGSWGMFKNRYGNLIKAYGQDPINPDKFEPPLPLFSTAPSTILNRRSLRMLNGDNRIPILRKLCTANRPDGWTNEEVVGAILDCDPTQMFATHSMGAHVKSIIPDDVRAWFRSWIKDNSPISKDMYCRVLEVQSLDEIYDRRYGRLSPGQHTSFWMAVERN